MLTWWLKAFASKEACLVIHLAAFKSFKPAQVIAQSSSKLKSLGKNWANQPNIEAFTLWSMAKMKKTNEKKPVIIEK